jgi:hypothetical protein
MKKELPGHLGGSMGVCHVDLGVLEFALSLGVDSLLDIGCGLGVMVELGMSFGYLLLLLNLLSLVHFLY